MALTRATGDTSHAGIVAMTGAARKPGRQRRAQLLVLYCLLCAVACAGAAGVVGLGDAPSIAHPGMLLLLGAGCLALVGMWIGMSMVTHHFDALEKLTGLVLMAGAGEAAAPEAWAMEERELDRLASVTAEALRGRATQSARPDHRFAMIVGALDHGVVVTTDSGLVSLVNGPAQAALGAEAVAVGTSVFAALDERPLGAAMREAAENGPTETTLTTTEGTAVPCRVVAMTEPNSGAVGFVVILRETGAGAATASTAAVSHDLSIHDQAPEIGQATPETPLDQLSAWVLDTETTGLDVTKDKIISIGGVRMRGPRVYRADEIDWLVNPRMPIPPISTGIHGISDGMMTGVPPFRDIADKLLDRFGPAGLIGHNIGFDAALLERAFAEHGGDWRPPWLIDTIQIVAALEPRRVELDLEHLTRDMGIAIEGRHTALGDSLATARLYASLLPRLRERGVTTLGALQDFAATAKRVIARQRAVGW